MVAEAEIEIRYRATSTAAARGLQSGDCASSGIDRRGPGLSAEVREKLSEEARLVGQAARISA